MILLSSGTRPARPCKWIFGLFTYTYMSAYATGADRTGASVSREPTFHFCCHQRWVIYIFCSFLPLFFQLDIRKVHSNQNSPPRPTACLITASATTPKKKIKSSKKQKKTKEEKKENPPPAHEKRTKSDTQSWRRPRGQASPGRRAPAARGE